MPGIWFSDAPDRDHFTYTFDNLAGVMQGFIDKLELRRFGYPCF